MRALAAASVLVALVGCGGGSADPVSDDELAELRAPGQGPFYWAGREVAGLPLTHAQSTGRGRASFLYGDCDPRGGLFVEGGCAPPVQIQTHPFQSRQRERAYACTRLPTVRGIPTARHDSLVLFTGTSVVKVYARSPAEERRVASALRTLDGDRTLPRPPRAIVEAVERACGAT